MVSAFRCAFFSDKKMSIIWVFVVWHTVTAFHIDFTSLFGARYCAWSFSVGKCVHNGTASNDTFVDFLTTLFECFENTPKLDHIVCRWCMWCLYAVWKKNWKSFFPLVIGAVDLLALSNGFSCATSLAWCMVTFVVCHAQLVESAHKRQLIVGVAPKAERKMWQIVLF